MPHYPANDIGVSQVLQRDGLVGRSGQLAIVLGEGLLCDSFQPLLRVKDRRVATDKGMDVVGTVTNEPHFLRGRKCGAPSSRQRVVQEFHPMADRSLRSGLDVREAADVGGGDDGG